MNENDAMARAGGRKDLKRLIRGDMRNLTFAVVMFLSLAVSGTMAYISARSGYAPNVFKSVSAPAPVIVETDAKGSHNFTDTHDHTITFSGTDPVKKQVQVYNQAGDGLLRVRITLPQQLGSNGTYVAYDMGEVDDYGFVDPQGASSVQVGAYTLAFASGYASKWAYRDGWFYYTGVFEHGATTEPLLASVSFSGAPEHELEVGVIAETLQKDAEVANTTWGLTTSGGRFVNDGGTISWTTSS